jgi:hypothetical protein
LPEETIIVASLSKGERETVLNSKIVKENKKENVSNFDTSDLEDYSTDTSIIGLLFAIQLSTKFRLNLSATN